MKPPDKSDFDGYKLRDLIVDKWGVPFDITFRPVTSLGREYQQSLLSLLSLLPVHLLTPPETSIYANIMPVVLGGKNCQHKTELDYLSHLQAIMEILDKYPPNLQLLCENIRSTAKTPRGNT